MTIRFVYQGVVGSLTILLVLILGEKGGAAIALYAFLPLVVRLTARRKPDERELQLFYRTGNMSMGLTFVVLVVVYFLARLQPLAPLIAANWLALTHLRQLAGLQRANSLPRKEGMRHEANLWCHRLGRFV